MGLSVLVKPSKWDKSTYMHCSQSATKKVTKAATTIVSVPHTSFRKTDFSGAMRKYETRMDIFTKLDANTKSVCPAMDAYDGSV